MTVGVANSAWGLLFLFFYIGHTAAMVNHFAASWQNMSYLSVITCARHHSCSSTVSWNWIIFI